MPNNFAGQTARYKYRMNRGEFGRDDHIRMTRAVGEFVQRERRLLVDAATTLAAVNCRRCKTVRHVSTAAVERQQPYSITERRGYNSSIR